MEINNFKDNNLSQNMDDKIYLANISHFLKRAFRKDREDARCFNNR